MERRKFLGKGINTSFLLGLAGGAAAGVAGTVAIAPKFMQPQFLPGKLSYAQQGEDIVLWQILFYGLGSTGVLVEPNPGLHEVLKQVRPRDVLVGAGIGVTAQAEADFYIIGGSEDGQLNTFSREQAETLVARSRGQYSIAKVLKVPLLNINDLMRKHWNGPPNLLSIDTEGFDLQILRSIDFKRMRPDVICVETLEIGGRRVLTEIMQLMAKNGYEARGGSFVNTIFVDRRHLA